MHLFSLWSRSCHVLSLWSLNLKYLVKNIRSVSSWTETILKKSKCVVKVFSFSFTFTTQSWLWAEQQHLNTSYRRAPSSGALLDIIFTSLDVSVPWCIFWHFYFTSSFISWCHSSVVTTLSPFSQSHALYLLIERQPAHHCSSASFRGHFKIVMVRFLQISVICYLPMSLIAAGDPLAGPH